MDASGVAHVTGSKGSDAFAIKVSASGSSLLYSVTLSGSGTEVGHAVAVDGSGNAHLTGSTDSSNFPVSASPYQGTLSGTSDSFSARLDSAGATSYATY